MLTADHSSALVVPGALPELTVASASNATLQQQLVATLQQQEAEERLYQEEHPVAMHGA